MTKKVASGRKKLQEFPELPYIAPEHIDPSYGKLSHKTDIYQLGISLYWLLTGRYPFTGNSAQEIIYKVMHEIPRPPHELNPEVPECVSGALLRALAKRPGDRYDSALEFRDALKRCLEEAEAESSRSIVSG